MMHCKNLHFVGPETELLHDRMSFFCILTDGSFLQEFILKKGGWNFLGIGHT